MVVRGIKSLLVCTGIIILVAGSGSSSSVCVCVHEFNVCISIHYLPLLFLWDGNPVMRGTF